MPWWAWVGLTGLGLDVLGATAIAFEYRIGVRFFNGMDGFFGMWEADDRPVAGTSPGIDRVHRWGWIVIAAGFGLQAVGLIGSATA